MTRNLAICLVLMIAGSALAVAQDDLFGRYNAAQTNTAQLTVLKNIAKAKPSGAGEFYAKALNKVFSDYRNIPIKNITERKAAEDQAILLSSLLASEKYSEAADDLWRVQESFTEPLVKAETLMALGKIGATQYLPQVIRVLEGLNVAPTTDRLAGERVAYGAILSLQEYKDPSGYLPVFFASIGWYSQRIRDQAVKSYTAITDDPYEQMMPIVTGAGYSYPVRYEALKTIEASKTSNTQKAEIAVAAFTEGWRQSSDDLELIKALANIRKLSITMIGKYTTDDASVYPLLEKSYAMGYDAQEKLGAISALGILGTEDAAQLLSKFLFDLNEKRKTNRIVKENEQMVRAIIPAIGQTARTLTLPALLGVADAGWPPAIKNLSDDAQKKLNR